MSTLPAQGYLSDSARTNAEMETAIEEVRDFIAELPGGGARTELTIASGAIVPPDGAGGGHHSVDTEGGGGTDDLTNITLTNTPIGRIIRLYAENVSRVVTCKHASGGSGEMQMIDSADFVLDALDKWIEFQLRSTTWVEVARNYGIDYAAARASAKLGLPLTGSVLAPNSSLKVSNSSATAVAITATTLVITNSSGDEKTFSSVSESADITVAGAGGLDTGSEGSSTWYHIYIIGKEDGTVDALLSESAVAPTLPSGYTYFGYVGAVYNDSGSAFDDFSQVGHRVGSLAGSALSNGSATSATSVALATFIPSTAKAVRCNLAVSDTAAAARSAQIGPTSTATIGHSIVNNPGSASASGSMSIIPLTVQQTIYYLVGGANGRLTITVTGWEF